MAKSVMLTLSFLMFIVVIIVMMLMRLGCRFVAVAVVDMEFLAIDFNPCPRSDGNDPPNYFYNISRCKPSTVVSFPFLTCTLYVVA